MQEFMQDKASIKDVADQLDEDQDSVVNNQPEVITTATEEISQESCAKLVGRCFAEATGSDVALISLGTWISGNGTNQNNDGVSGKLYAKNITDYDVCIILPTGWSQTIKTIRLTGKQIQALYEEGYDAVGTGKNYPYMLVNPEDMELEDGKTYQVGEFSTDNPSSAASCLYVKLLKGITMSPDMPFWDLMMKNIYSLGAYSVQKEKFKLNIMYQSDTTGTYVNYLPEGAIANQILLRVLNLDSYDSNNQPHPDGIYDFIEGVTVLADNGKIIFPKCGTIRLLSA